MSEYRPTSRRPIAALFRRTADGAVRLCVRWHIHPDAISYGSMVAATAGAACFWQSGHMPWLLIPAALLCYLRLWLNMLDGMVALASGKASRRGEILNELPDRFSDVVIFIGVAHSGWCHPLGAYGVAIAALAVAYVGTFGQALGVGRQFGGVMAKPGRMVALHVGAWTTLALWWAGASWSWAWPWPRGELTVLDWTHLVILIGCAQTVWVRLARILATLRTQEQQEA